MAAGTNSRSNSAQDDRSSIRRSTVRLLLSTATVLFVGCFEDPIKEQLELRFTDEFTLAAQYRVRLVDRWWDEEDNESFHARMLEEQKGLLEGWHPWLERLDSLDHVSDGGSWTRRERHVVEFERWILTSEAERGLQGLFAGTLVQPALSVGDQTVTVSFQTFPGSRANASETRWIEAKLDDWSEAVAIYYRALDALWRRLAAEPDNAEALLRKLFDDLLDERTERPDSEDIENSDEEPSDPEVERVLDAEEAVLALFEVEDGEAFTLQELSRKLLDPFPAHVLIEPAGPVIEVDGLVETGEGLLAIPRRSLWDSFRALEGRWLAPDPLLVRVAKARNETLRFDLKQFMDQDFVYPPVPPSAGDVERALIEVARGAAEYRVVWERRIEDEQTP